MDLDELERRALDNLREYDILWQRGREPFLRVLADLAAELAEARRERDDFSREVAADRRQIADMIQRRDELIGTGGQIDTLRADRDRLRAALELIIQTDYPGGACTSIAKRALRGADQPAERREIIV